MIVVTAALIDDDSDREQFRRLFKKYKSRVYAAAYRLLSNEALAEEAVQETFLCLAKNYSIVKRLEERQLESYIIICARTAALGTYRKEKRHLQSERLDDPEVTDESFSCVDKAELRAAIASLGSADRQVLYLYYVLGLDGKQLGSTLGISVSAARKRAQYARTRLKSALEGGNDDE